MGIILGELPNSEKPVYDAAGLVSVHQAKLRNPHWKLAIRMLSGFINQAAARAVHRLYGIGGIIETCEVHILFIVVPMAASVPELLIEDYAVF